MDRNANESAESEETVSPADVRSLSASSVARASMVNRTHRVVHARATSMKARKRQVRSLWFPLLVSSALVIILITGIWTALAEYAQIETGVPESSQQILVLLLWFLPLSAAILAMVWFRRSREQRDRVDEEQG